MPLKKRGGDTGGAAEVDLVAVGRFVESIPTLQQLLASPVVSEREVPLRVEMRRTIAQLAATLHEAASGERQKLRAAVYRAAALVAADLAGLSATSVAAPVRRDH